MDDDGNTIRTGLDKQSRGHWPNTPGGRRRQRIEDVRTHMPPVYNKNGEESFGRSRRRFEGAVARSSMPAEDLDAINQVHLTRANQSTLAEYEIRTRNMNIPTYKNQSLKRDNDSDKTLLAHSIIHETGHGVDRNLNPEQFFPLADKRRSGRREAVAENYAGKHTRGYGGDSADYSTYDAAVDYHGRRTGGYGPIKKQFGANGVATYKGFRQLGMTPHDEAPSDEVVNQKLSAPWYPKVDPRWG